MSKYLAMSETQHVVSTKSEREIARRSLAWKMGSVVLLLLAKPLSVFMLKPINIHPHQPVAVRIRVRTYDPSC